MTNNRLHSRHKFGKEKLFYPLLSQKRVWLLMESGSLLIRGMHAFKYDQRSGLTSSWNCTCDKDTADQRAGRAGDLGPGSIYRLWSEGSNHHLVEHRAPWNTWCWAFSSCAGLASGAIMIWLNSPGSTPPPAKCSDTSTDFVAELNALENERITDQENFTWIPNSSKNCTF